MLPPFCRETSLPRGIKGGAAYKALQVWCIEGEYVNTQQIGERMGITQGTAKKKLKRLRDLSSPITWAALEKGK